MMKTEREKYEEVKSLIKLMERKTAAAAAEWNGTRSEKVYDWPEMIPKTCCKLFHLEAITRSNSSASQATELSLSNG